MAEALGRAKQHIYRWSDCAAMDVSRVRQDFPVLQHEDVCYLDSACQSLRPRQVVEAMDSYYLEYPACGGRSVHRLASRVAVAVDEAREAVSSFIHLPEPNGVVFTKNCTEAINIVAQGLPLRKGDVVLTSDIEHNSNNVPWIMLQPMGLKRRVVRTPDSGIHDLERWKEAIRRDVRLVSVAHINNVVGSTLPLREICEMAHDVGAEVLVDGAQSVPHMPIDITSLKADYLAFSAHKMLGPSGIGILAATPQKLERLRPLITGGGSVLSATNDSAEFLPVPEKLEAGLLNYAGIVGTKAAIDYLNKIGMEEVREHDTMLNREVTALLRDDRIEILEPRSADMRSGIFSFNVRGLRSHDVAMFLDEMGGIMIRSGAHCAHPYFEAHHIDGCARASFYLYNTKEECRRLSEAVLKLADSFSK
jgi:cysteine desulfurase/selenocysteine lyase